MSASGAQVAATVSNRKADAERVRIGWRVWVMGQPGGVDWLCQYVRLREQDMGPRVLTFPGATWTAP